jgi:hypothetical protein
MGDGPRIIVEGEGGRVNATLMRVSWEKLPGNPAGRMRFRDRCGHNAMLLKRGNYQPTFGTSKETFSEAVDRDRHCSTSEPSFNEFDSFSRCTRTA